MVQLTLANAGSASDAARQFFANEAVVAGQRWDRPVDSLSSVGSSFGVRDASGQIQIEGWAAFAEHGGKVYQLLGYARSNAAGSVSDVLRRSVASLRPVRDRRILDAQPLRLDLVRVDRSTTLSEVAGRSPVPIADLALVNRVAPNTTLERGALVKVVRGTVPHTR
jgi:predicted Zn-dependent protease